MHTSQFAYALALVSLITACGGEAGRGVARGGSSETAALDTMRMAAPDTTTLGHDPLSRSIRRGLALVRAARDSLPGHVGSQLRCVSCHLEDGRRAYAMSWVGVYGRFPQYRSRSGRVAGLEERINDCFSRSLNGRPLPLDGDDLRDITSYLSWLSRGTPSGARLRGSGIDSLAPLVPDTARGALVYAQHCVRCHAADGGGMLGRGLANAGPPLWGPGSFNIGSGMARVRVMAAFVHRQMPFDQRGTLTPPDAFAVAAYVVSKPRPDFPGKELDWPNGDPPVDVAYRTTARRPAARP
ncbi:MAG TPA: c-type cytochrome [Gemmatimonadaceae bacterium]|jgi:thiosulfate dehydrogenase